MKLSLWTIQSELESRNYDVTSSIAEGLPRISQFRTSDSDHYDDSYLEVLPWNCLSGTTDTDVVLSCSFEHIIVHHSTTAEICSVLGEIFSFYINWENQICIKMVENGTLQEILEIGASAFHRPMFIKNNSNWTFAITRGYSANTHPYWRKFEESVEHRTLDSDSIRAVSTDPIFQNVFLEKYPSISRSPSYGAMVLHANVFSDNKRIAEIVALENGTPFNHGEVHLMHVFASLIEKYIRNDPEILLTVSDPGTYLIPLIETGRLEQDKLSAIYRYTGLEPDSEICVAIIQRHVETDTPLLAVLKEKISQNLSNAAVFLYKNQIICIPKIDEKRKYDQIVKKIKELLQGDSYHWAVSYEFSSLEDVREYYRQACMVLSKTTSSDKEYTTMYEAASECISDLFEDLPQRTLLIHPDVLRLEQIDKNEGTQYADTLYRFLLCGGNFTDTAALMGLHRNSLIYRMNKIRSIMHTNPDDIKNRELLIASFLLCGTKE